MDLFNCRTCDEEPVVKAGMAFCMECMQELPVEEWDNAQQPLQPDFAG